MKKTFVIFLLMSLFIVSCKKEKATPVLLLNESTDTSAVLKYKGSFTNGSYGTVSGKAKIYLQKGTYKLVLDTVNISNGPDLHVYLSKELQPVNFIDLGKLKSIAGNQVYSITGSPDFTQYKFALIHCQQYNHLFGSAVLQ